MFKQCVALAMLGTVLAVPIAQYQQQPEGIPPHLLRQYIGQQQQIQQQQIQQAQHQPQLLRPAAPAPVRLPYSVQSEDQYQQQPQQVQYRPQPQPQAIQYRPQPQPQLQQVQYRPQAQPQPQPQYRPQPQAQPAYKLQQQQSEGRDPQEDYDPNPSYQFGFDVNDDQFTNYQNRKEQRDGDVIKGSYSVVDSDGFIRTVTYTADPKEGFKAEVSRQPTDIVVKVPTQKPQLAQQLSHQPIAHRPQPQLAQQPIAHRPQQQPQPQQAQPPQQYYRYEQ